LKKLLILFLLFNTIVFSKTITVAVAANVSYAIPKLVKEFNKQYPNIKVRVILGGSGKLTAQIKHHAPYDIFMSANMNYPDALYNDKIALNKPAIYAQGSLSYLSVKPRDFSLKMKLLEHNDIKRITIANPKTAPYGKATVEALKNANIYNKIKSKFIYAESISQTVTYTKTAADIGFIAKSALFSPQMSMYKKNINYIDVDTKLYTPIDQGIVILKNSPEVLKFYNFILSNQAKNILKKFGYIVS